MGRGGVKHFQKINREMTFGIGYLGGAILTSIAAIALHNSSGLIDFKYRSVVLVEQWPSCADMVVRF